MTSTIERVDVVSQIERALGATGGIVDSIEVPDYDAPTPCPG